MPRPTENAFDHTPRCMAILKRRKWRCTRGQTHGPLCSLHARLGARVPVFWEARYVSGDGVITEWTPVGSIREIGPGEFLATTGPTRHEAGIIVGRLNYRKLGG